MNSELGRLHRMCETCKRTKNQNFYVRYPHSAVIKLLPKKMQESRIICTDCAKAKGMAVKKRR